MIVQKDGKWVVMDSKGNKVLGTHSSKKEAEGQLTAIHISQKKKSFKDHLEEAASLTLQYHDELNPKFWENDQLKEEVREKLLEIADAWIEFAQIPTEAVVDVLFVGGNANYNYTNYSDIDVHILIDKDKMPDCPDLLF
jgi:UTP:GlnB (protein PII) uridylyltransferase